MGRDARGRSRVFRNPAQASWRPGTRGGTGGAAGAAPCGAEGRGSRGRAPSRRGGPGGAAAAPPGVFRAGPEPGLPEPGAGLVAPGDAGRDGRGARGRDAAGAGFLGRLEAAGEDARVSVEPLRDWLGLRNGLAAASRVLGFMTNPPLADGLDPRALRAAPLAAAGFERAGGQYRLPSSPSLSVACGEGDAQAEVARRYIGAEFDAWLRPTVALDEGLGLEVSPTSVGTGLVTGLWRMLALRDGWEVAICPNCGSAFMRPSKGYAARRRQWCDNSCHLLYAKRGGPGAWFDAFKARCDGR